MPCGGWFAQGYMYLHMNTPSFTHPSRFFRLQTSFIMYIYIYLFIYSNRGHSRWSYGTAEFEVLFSFFFFFVFLSVALGFDFFGCWAVYS